MISYALKKKVSLMRTSVLELILTVLYIRRTKRRTRGNADIRTYIKWSTFLHSARQECGAGPSLNFGIHFSAFFSFRLAINISTCRGTVTVGRLWIYRNKTKCCSECSFLKTYLLRLKQVWESNQIQWREKVHCTVSRNSTSNRWWLLWQ